MTDILEPILIILSVFSITLFGFLFVIVRYNKNRIVQIRDKQRFQQILLSAQIETQEQTFENISQELHDNIGQQMTALNFQLENQKIKQPGHKEYLDKVSVTIGHIAQQLQTLSHSLNQNWVQHQGLITSIEKELERLSNLSTLSFHFECDHPELLALSKDKQIIIFRIFQEILNNALKHAQAKQIDIFIKTAPHFLLSVKDDGKGFDLEQVSEQSSGIGLQNIKNRAQVIGFDCFIQAGINAGTSFLITERLSL